MITRYAHYIKELYEYTISCVYPVTFYYLIQNTAYRGTDFILFSKPKFLADILILYLGLYFFIYSFKLLLLDSLPLLTSTEIISPSIFIRKSISYLSKL